MAANVWAFRNQDMRSLARWSSTGVYRDFGTCILQRLMTNLQSGGRHRHKDLEQNDVSLMKSCRIS